jgi:hypothetical protein
LNHQRGNIYAEAVFLPVPWKLLGVLYSEPSREGPKIKSKNDQREDIKAREKDAE